MKHTNIVNFVSFWHDKMNGQDRVRHGVASGCEQQDLGVSNLCFACCEQLVFITEYMTSGSLMQFLNKAKVTKNTISEKVSSHSTRRAYVEHQVISIPDVEKVVSADSLCTQVSHDTNPLPYQGTAV